LTEAATPQRRCLVCRDRHDKSEMMRLALDDEGEVWPDVLQKAQGRGTYLCMQQRCLQGLGDKQMKAAWRRQRIASGQGVLLQERMAVALSAVCRQYLSQQRATTTYGRDAVLRRLWHEPAVLVLLATDAGAALVRQIDAAVEKRHTAGTKVMTAPFPSSALMGGVFDREDVSVAAVDMSPMARKLLKFCTWYGRLKGLR